MLPSIPEPERVSEFMVDPTTIDSTTLTLKWQPSANSEQDAYQIDYQGIQSQKEWKPFESVTGLELEVKDLYPGDHYTFRIAAKSNSQTSESRTSSFVVTCKYK